MLDSTTAADSILSKLRERSKLRPDMDEEEGTGREGPRMYQKRGSGKLHISTRIQSLGNHDTIWKMAVSIIVLVVTIYSYISKRSKRHNQHHAKPQTPQPWHSSAHPHSVSHPRTISSPPPHPHH